jgi:hypothetical protein
MRRLNWAVQVALLIVSIVASSALVQAQYRASIQGVVTDPTGAVVPGATLTLKNKETNQTQTVTSNDVGIYNFVALPPSHYTVTVEKAGFKKKILDDLGIIAEQANAVNIELEIGQSTETVTVTGESTPLIDTQTAQLGSTITEQQIKTMPSFGRDVFQLAQLAHGAFGDAARDSGGGSADLPGTNIGSPGASEGIFKTENGPQIIANGNTINSNGITIDGVSTVSVSWGGTSVVTPNEESVKEVKVVTNAYDAESGRSSGAQIKVISKNGTNDYHGSLFLKNDSPGLNAYQKYNGPTNTVQRNNARFNDYGGSVGGPIWKNKIFAFFSYETIRNHGTDTPEGWYETPQFLSLAPSAGPIAQEYLTFPGEGASYKSILDRSCGDAGLYDAAHATVENPQNCQAIAGQGLDIGRPLTTGIGYRDGGWAGSTSPGTGGDGKGGSNNLDGVPDIMYITNSVARSDIEAQYNGRLDFQVTSNDLVAFSIYKVPVTNTSLNGPSRLANHWNHSAMNEAETALWNHTFSPTLLNEVRVNAAGWRWNELQTNTRAPWGLVNLNIDTIGTAGPQGYGVGSNSHFGQWTYNFKDVATKVYHSHTLKFGADITRIAFLDSAPWNARPSYNFRNMWDFLNDAPYKENGAAFDPITGFPTDIRKDMRGGIYGLFIQDDYKLRQNLTVNLGLRWEYFGSIHSKENNLDTLLLGSGANVLTDMRIKVGGNLAVPPKGNFGPQLGFAWSPTKYNSKLVFRGGFGIGYTGLEAAISLNGRGNPPSQFYYDHFDSGEALNDLGQIVYGVPTDPHSYGPFPSNPNTISPIDATTHLPTTGAPVSVTGFPYKMPTMYTYRYSFETEYDLGRDWVATIGYQGSTSRHMTRQYNLALVYSQVAPQNPMVNTVDWYANDANANFNALLAGVRHRFSRSFQVDGSYRWSRSRDQGSHPYYTDNYMFDPSAYWGPSDYDTTHAFKLWGVYTTPNFFHGDQAWLDKVVGGWSISGIWNAHTGFPWTPVYHTADDSTCSAVIANNYWTCDMRPAAYKGGAGSDTSNAAFMRSGGNFPNGWQAYFDPATFTQGGTFPDVGPLPQRPSVGRNSFRGPRYFDIDMTITKSFGLPKMPVLGENAKFELRADFFNAFNKLNLTNIQTDMVRQSQYFGMAMNGLAGRTIEVQARFSF